MLRSLLPAGFFPPMSALALLAVPAAVSAATFEWNSAAASNAWSAPGNWTLAQAPPTSGLADTNIVYGSSLRTQPALGSGYSIRSLTFNNATNGYSFSTGSLTLGAGGISQASSSGQAFSIPVSLGAAATFSFGTGSPGALQFNSGLDLGSFLLTVEAATSGTIDGVLSGTGALIKTGGGVLTLTGQNTFTGTTNIRTGTVLLAGGRLVGPIDMGSTVAGVGTALIIGAGGAVEHTASSPFLTVVESTTSVPARIVLGDGGSIQSGNVYVGLNGQASCEQTGGSFVALPGRGLRLGYLPTGEGTYRLSGGTLTTDFLEVGTEGKGTFLQSGGTAIFGLRLGRAVTSQSYVHLDGGVLQPTSLEVGPGASFLFWNGGVLRAGGGTTAFLQGLNAASVRPGGAVVDTAGFNVTIAQVLQHSLYPGDPALDGGLTKLGAGNLTLTGLNTFTGDVRIRGGTLTVSAENRLGAGSAVYIDPGAALAFTGTSVTLSRTYSFVSGTLSPPSGGALTYAAGAVVHGATLGSGSHFVTGNATLQNVRTGANTSIGAGSGTLTAANFTLGGSAIVGPSAVLNASAGFVALPPSTLTIQGFATLTGGYLSGALTLANGGILVTGGSGTPLYLDGTRGTTIDAGGALQVASGATVELGGLLINNGTQIGRLNVNLGGVVRGNGSFGTVQLAAGASFTAAGSASSLTVAADAVVTLDGTGRTLNVSGSFSNAGTMRFSNGARLRLTAPAAQVVNTGVIDVISGQLELPAGFVNQGVILDSSLVQVQQVSRENGTVSLQIAARAGHTYRLQRRPSLGTGAFVDVPGVPPQTLPATATSPVTFTFTDPAPAADQGFYRIQLDG